MITVVRQKSLPPECVPWLYDVGVRQTLVVDSGRARLDTGDDIPVTQKMYDTLGNI